MKILIYFRGISTLLRCSPTQGEKKWQDRPPMVLFVGSLIMLIQRIIYDERNTVRVIEREDNDVENSR